MYLKKFSKIQNTHLKFGKNNFMILKNVKQ